MNISKLRPIPKAIEKRILKIDEKAYCGYYGNRLYSYLTTIGKEVVRVTVALKTFEHQTFIKQVAVHGVESPECWVRDMEYSCLGMGYRYGFEDVHIGHKNFEDGKWYSAKRCYYNAYSYLVNLDYLKNTKYKYCGYNKAFGKDLLDYLRIYDQYPKAEYLAKMGLLHLAFRKTLLRSLEKDKLMYKWIIANKDELKRNYYTSKTVLQAYKMGRPIKWVYDFNKWQESMLTYAYSELKDVFLKDEKIKLYEYLNKQDCELSIYNDYFKACNYLRLDMTLDKNRYPHELMKWHDIRIDQMNAKKAQEDEEKRKELYQKFATVADKYVSMQRIKDNYITLIAKSPAELIQEGEALHHCVGRMGYDEKFANEKSLIFFVRDCEQPDKPFVTLEYSIESHKVLQCYADHNHKPSDSVMQYVNKKWLPYANRHLKQIQNYAIA